MTADMAADAAEESAGDMLREGVLPGARNAAEAVRVRDEAARPEAPRLRRGRGLVVVMKTISAPRRSRFAGVPEALAAHAPINAPIDAKA